MYLLHMFFTNHGKGGYMDWKDVVRDEVEACDSEEFYTEESYTEVHLYLNLCAVGLLLSVFFNQWSY